MEPLCRIGMLGGLRALVRDREITRFRTQKTGALLAYLAYHLDQLHPREVLAEMLWPWSAPTAGRKSLTMALSSLRSQLEPPGIDAGSVIQADRQSVGLNAAAVTTDVTEFHALLRRAEVADSDAERLQCTAEAVALYRGPLLPGYYQDWLLPEQRRLADAYFAALRHLTNELAARGDYQGAIDHARQAVSFDPIREGAHEHLIRLLIAAGDPVAAVRQYEELEQLLEEQLGEQPSAALRTLRRELPSAPARQRDNPLPKPPPSAPLDTTDQTLGGTIALLLGEVLSGDGNGSQANGTDSKSIQEARELVSGVAARHGGHAANGAGDILAFAFPRPSDALAAAIECQRGTGEPCRERPGVVQLRLALDTGEAQPVGGSYRGPLLDRATGILLAAHPGQILCSEAAVGVLRSELCQDVRLVDLGFYGLRTVEAPERLFTVEHPEVTRATFPPPNAALAHRSNLPSQFTRFFGRDAELARVKDLLASDGARLITLTGSGGSGKTRLAIEAARAALSGFRGAVWFVALQELTDADLLPRAVVAAVGAPPVPDLQPLDQAVGLLSRQPSLLVLDNFEHLVIGGALIVQDWLERVSELKVLVTSRRCLNVSGETELLLGPLPTPTGEASAEELVRCPSVQLFVDRAQTAKPDFQVTELNAPAISELCERLEGIPLALELAGARAQVLTPSQMLEQMEERFGFLVTRKRDVADRHRTLWAALDWSYQLLAPELQRFLSCLSVFRGGWTAEAAAAVCDEPRALDFLQQLREASLVTSVAHRGEMRFGLLESTREFAWQKLSEAERSELRDRHAEHYLAMAEEGRRHLRGPDQAIWFDRLDAEHGNMCFAIEHFISAGDREEECLRFCSALGLVWRVRGHLQQGHAIMKAVVSVDDPPKPSPVAVQALQAAANLAQALGHNEDARDLLQASLNAARSIGDKSGEGHALNGLASLALSMDARKTRQLAEESLAAFEAAGDPAGAAGALATLGVAAWYSGDLAEGRRLTERALGIARELGNMRAIEGSLLQLGAIAHAAGDCPSARRFLEEGLELARELGDKSGIAGALGGLGSVALEEGDDATALELLQETLAIERDLGLPMGVSLRNVGSRARIAGDLPLARSLFEEAVAEFRRGGGLHGVPRGLIGLAMVLAMQGEHADARARLEEALGIVIGASDGLGTVACLEAFGLLSGCAGEPERGVRLLGAADALREEVRAPKPVVGHVRREVELNRAITRGNLDDETYQAAYAEGRAMDREQAIAYALEQDDPPDTTD